MSICPHLLVEDVVECHQLIPSNCGWIIGRSDFEGIVDVRIERAIHSIIYVACCVVVVLLALECCRDTEHLLTSVWYDVADVVQDLREFWYSRIVWEVE